MQAFTGFLIRKGVGDQICDSWSVGKRKEVLPFLREAIVEQAVSNFQLVVQTIFCERTFCDRDWAPNTYWSSISVFLEPTGLMFNWSQSLASGLDDMSYLQNAGCL